MSGILMNNLIQLHDIIGFKSIFYLEFPPLDLKDVSLLRERFIKILWQNKKRWSTSQRG